VERKDIMTDLTLAKAEILAKAAMTSAREKKLNPMSIAVIDSSLHLKFALREDGAGLAGIDIAAGKARAALTFGCSSQQIADALAGNPLAGPSVVAVLQGRVVLLGGGVLIKDEAGAVVGAIGAAGDAPSNDEAIVLAAVDQN
jgi:uncharacterized protein GlcG (DUF336 family)